MDPDRKRQIRLVVALSAAVLLAAALAYTSFSASSEARQPSQLLNANPDRSYDLTGKVAAGSVRRHGERLDFRVSDRDGSGAIPVRYQGTVPDPFREGREVVVSGHVRDGVFIGERDTLSTKCPSKFSEGKPR
ncbi:MAG: cytochrome c-type biosis protein CcmE [Solirubrobacterales bacterium]|jgi:cytochrome c-type biogenesis protein CcmE|nr:cytochrome c-type biosis protein CcmE [Solirubrobacterales bacterium]MDX6651939.1 cytochrome c-type biosis protein CcmE [Solirubrobacterales bacterium]